MILTHINTLWQNVEFHNITVVVRIFARGALKVNVVSCVNNHSVFLQVSTGSDLSQSRFHSWEEQQDLGQQSK
jgi:hypothetical protein